MKEIYGSFTYLYHWRTDSLYIKTRIFIYKARGYTVKKSIQMAYTDLFLFRVGALGTKGTVAGICSVFWDSIVHDPYPARFKGSVNPLFREWFS